MLSFHKPEIADRAWIQPLYEASGYRGAEYTFANLYLWSYYYGEVTEFGGYLCQKLTFEGMHQYLYPAGSGDIRPVLEALWQDSRQAGRPFVLCGLTKETWEELNRLYPDQFTLEEARNAFDYLYEIDTLADLQGKKYQSKRNHIHRFEDAFPNWRTELVTNDNLDVCRALAEKWYKSHHDSPADRRAMEKAFANFDALDFSGMLLFGETEPVAVTMGNRISQDTFDVNFEKAFADIQGAYAMINREYARHIRETIPEIRYLNREDDMGIEGLRKAKESYHPILLEKYIAAEKA